VVNNTFVNDLGRGDFIRIRAPTTAHVISNIFVGRGNVLVGAGTLENNLLAAAPGGSPHIEQSLFRTGGIAERGTRSAVDPGFADLRNYDYRLTANSPAIGAGIDPGRVNNFTHTDGGVRAPGALAADRQHWAGRYRRLSITVEQTASAR
jgi:hypothetical protein